MAREIGADREAAMCTGKVRFGSFREAAGIAKRSRKNGRKGDRQMRAREPYRCGVCHGYHLGRRTGLFQKRAFARFVGKYRGRHYGDCSETDET